MGKAREMPVFQSLVAIKWHYVWQRLASLGHEFVSKFQLPLAFLPMSHFSVQLDLI